MRKLLDKMFQNKKFLIVAPIIVACVVYSLFVLFGDNADLRIVTPIACAGMVGISSVFFAHSKRTK